MKKQSSVVKILRKHLKVLKMLKMKSGVVKILKIQFWVLKIKGRVNVLFRRRGIMQSKSQQSVEVGPIPAAAEESSDSEDGGGRYCV